MSTERLSLVPCSLVQNLTLLARKLKSSFVNVYSIRVRQSGDISNDLGWLIIVSELFLMVFGSYVITLYVVVWCRILVGATES